MASIKENWKRFKEIVNYPVGKSKKRDEKSEKAFLDFIDKLVTFTYGFFVMFGLISLYFFITRELLWLEIYLSIAL